MYFVIHFVIKDLTLYLFFVIWQNMQANLSEPGIFVFFRESSGINNYFSAMIITCSDFLFLSHF